MRLGLYIYSLDSPHMDSYDHIWLLSPKQIISISQLEDLYDKQESNSEEMSTYNLMRPGGTGRDS